MSLNLSPLGGVAGQFFDDSGNPLSGGKLFTYAAGTTTNLQTYTSPQGNTAHPNPIILDAAGRVPGGEIWLTNNLLYKFLVKTSTNVLIGTYDNVAGINSNILAYSNEQEIQTASPGQTVFTLTTTQYQPGTNTLSVFVNGINQYGPGAQYQYLETNSTTVTFLAPLTGGEKVKFTTSQLVSSNSTGANQVGYLPAGSGAVATTVQAKLRQSVSVVDYGAVGDGIANDTAAFAAAAAVSNYVIVPKGTYRLATDVVAPNKVFEFQDASTTGDGKLKVNNIISYTSAGVYVSKQNGFVEFNGQSNSFSDLATLNLGEYPKKYYPTAAYFEYLLLSPGVIQFESQSGLQTNAMNETYFREVIREMAGSGIQTIVVPYVAYFGFWFYKPNFAYPYDYDTSRTGKYWADWLTGYPNVIPFNPVSVMLDECAKLGMHVYLGVTRNGDSPLMNDLYSVNVLGNPDPMRYGLSLSTRLTNAVNQTRQIAADLVAQYGNIPSFAGFYISHEPDQLAAANNYLTPVTTTNGVDPALRSYNKPIMVAPSSPIDLANNSTFANTLIASGCDIFLPQDSVGPGYNFNTNLYTYVPSVPISQLANHYATWQGAVTIANAKQTLSDRSIRLWTTTEVWQMGVVQSTTLTLSAVSGGSVTATAGASVFLFTDVGKWISTADGGNAQITSFSSGTVVTVSTTVSGGTAFGSTSQLADTWSLNSQYTNAYPAAFARVQSQLFEEWPYIEAVALYAWFGYMDSGTLSLKLSQNNAGFSDYRTRAANLYQNYSTWQKGQRDKYSTASNVAAIQQQFFERGSAPAATSLTSDFATFYPRSEGSRVTYFCVIRGYLSLGTSTLTLGLRVNNILVKSTQDVVVSNTAGGAYTFMYTETPKGLTRPVGISFSSTGANFNLLGVEVYVIETV